MNGSYYVYIMANASKMLYTGVTNNLERRVMEHKRHLIKGYTDKYDITRLIYYETFRVSATPLPGRSRSRVG